MYMLKSMKQIEPDDRETPAQRKADGLDYVGMSKAKNLLIEVLTSREPDPSFGPIQGILFGPVAFIAIPLGNIFAGSVHDYFNGMISMRNGGCTNPSPYSKISGKTCKKILQCSHCNFTAFNRCSLYLYTR